MDVPSPLATFGLGFLFLVIAAVSAALAHFTSSGAAPWVSVAASVAAIVCTVVAVRTSLRA